MREWFKQFFCSHRFKFKAIAKYDDGVYEIVTVECSRCGEQRFRVFR